MTKIQIPTRFGTVVGVTDSAGVSAFKGIPYAKQPVGERRWLPPEHPDESDREIECLAFGNTAIQGIDTVEEASLFPQGEDCLSLNIWARGLRKEMAERQTWPVMVFIHGGSYMSGGTTDPLYDGYRFAADNDVVFVTINYRLSLLGFVSLEEIGGPAYRDSGHLGLLDQIAALEWVRENIALFGGDPGNVTIFGESCGGGSVSLLMTMERARGLFHKVIAQSGSVILRKGSDLSRRLGWDLMRKTGCRGMADLLRLDIDTIRKAMAEFEADYGMKAGIMYAPEADGRVLPRDPFRELERGSGRGVNLMIGTTANEFNYWKLYNENIEEIMPAFLADQLFGMGLVLHNQREVEEEFLRYRAERGLEENRIAFANEVLFRIPAIRMAEIQSRFADTWMYYFTWPSAVPGLSACHAIELPFVFNTLESHGCLEFTGGSPPRSLAERMQKTWVAFAASGNPENPSIPAWDKYDTTSRPTMVINDEWRLENDPEGESRRITERTYRAMG